MFKPRGRLSRLDIDNQVMLAAKVTLRFDLVLRMEIADCMLPRLSP